MIEKIKLRSLLEEAIEKGKGFDHEKAEREIEEESNQLAKKRFEMPSPIWSPRFTLTPAIARGLWARKKKPLTEELIKRLHALVESGPRASPTPYREGQNAIFEIVRLKAERCGAEGHPAKPEALRCLDHRARVVLGLFASQDRITAPQVASELSLSERMARNLLKDWVDDGWLEVADPSRRGRAYSLSAVYRQYIGSLSATTERQS